MAIPFSDNLAITGTLPDIARQEYATKADLKAVRKNRMPEMYMGYCLEDHKYYVFNKENDNDEVTGYWREFTGGTTIQVETMPEADETQVGKIYQYIGATDANYTNGYFYICNASGETQVVDITTLADLKDTINESENNIEVNNGTETVETKVFTFDSVNYYVIEDVVYFTSNATGDISVDTVLGTDEEVAALNLTKEIVVYTYSWSNKAVQPTTEMGDVLPYGAQFPENPEDRNAFLYVGPDTFIYQVATGLTPISNPQALGLYEEDGSGGYERSNDYQAVVTSYCWYNGSEELFTLSETPSVGDAVWKFDGSEYHSAGTVTEYDSSDGIKASESSWPESFYARHSSDDVAGKTYYESVPQYLSGQIYVYNQSTTSWINVSKKNVVKGQITEKIFSEIFENSGLNIISLDHNPTSSDSGRPYKLYSYSSSRVVSLYTPVRDGALAEESNMWVYLGNMTDEPGGPYYEVGEDFTLELYINILIANNIARNELPPPTEDMAGDIVLYTGSDDSSNRYYSGHVYRCVIEPAEWDPSANICYWKEIEGDITVDDITIDNLCDKYGDKEVDTTQGGDVYELGWEMRNGHKCYVYYTYNEDNQDYEWMDFRLDSTHPPAVFIYYEKRLSVVVGIMLANGSSGGGGAAEDITYANASQPTLTNVKLALDDLIAKVYYVAPEITSFTMTPATTEYEIGASVSDLVFAWTYNKDITTQTLTDCTLADETVRTATAAGPYTTNKTFTLSAGDGENTVTASKSISFKHKVYWGSAAIPTSPATYDSAFILALSDKKFATNTKGTYPMTVASDEYGFLAYPDSWGMVTGWWINGLQAETYDCGTVSFTNASGNTTTFRVLRTTQPSLGYITPEIK